MGVRVDKNILMTTGSDVAPGLANVGHFNLYHFFSHDFALAFALYRISSPTRCDGLLPHGEGGGFLLGPWELNLLVVWLGCKTCSIRS